MKNKKKPTPMEELTKNYEQFIKGKKLKKTGKEQFESAIKKAVTKPKQHGSK